ncbi:protein saal1 isoform X2 [Hippocampus comes]|uniref:protein saal1 isoform X1 n=1 Tax=Hippocampus comes TaxID=109280 RepID=UPI00094E12AE|nr:PREDICTED: protein SAAL1 isoform X1 [Hippocampus comes]XP_019712568.1 PREDICTED: protein SAAL1 isoform X2 [Hippocampus comes]
MDYSFDAAEDEAGGTCSPLRGALSPETERNPSPPPDTSDGDEAEVTDAIGDTVYSKHWLFSTLSRLIQMVTKSPEESDGQIHLTDDEEEDLCRVWDMAMDKDVAGFLQEFKAPEILLGVIAKSRNPRLTEICVGILGNIACFPDTCLTLSQNEDLGAVLLLLLGDADPPTLLETSRLILTCVSQKDVSSLWLQRIRQQTSVRGNLLFIMSSSTNTDLLEKVGELVDKLFDLDEELMKGWITARPSEEGDAGDSCLDLAPCLLEAAKQLRAESPNGLEVYLHVLQLLTTVKEGIQMFASSGGPGKAVWNFVCEVVCDDLCQPNDLAVVLQEQKGSLVQAFSVLQALYGFHEEWESKDDTSLPLVGTIFQLIQYQSEHKESTKEEDAQDEQLLALSEITSEFLSDMCCRISKDTVAALVKRGYLTEKNCLTAFGRLLPNYQTSFHHLLLMLSQTDPEWADKVRKQFPD